MTEPSAPAPSEEDAPTADDRPVPAVAAAPRPRADEPRPGTERVQPDADHDPASGGPAHADATSRTHGTTVSRRRRVLTRTTLVVLVLALAGAGVAVVHLWRTSDAWEDRAGGYQEAARELGGDLAGTRAELDGTRAELAAVRGQLENASTRIAELANEKAQIGDDREAQRQLVDYQERVTEAAGDVALALDQCVQGQQQLITYLRSQAAAPEGQEPYEPDELERFSGEVDTLCAAATEANNTLQAELER